MFERHNHFQILLSMALIIIAITRFPDLETLEKQGKYKSLELLT